MQLTEDQIKYLESVLSEEFKLDESFERAMQQIKDGQVKPHNEVRKKYEKWL